MSLPRRQQGLTYIELLVSAAILVVLAGVLVPLAHWDAKRRREVELRVLLETLREAIDQYNRYVVTGLIVLEDVEQCAFPADRATCYPPDLETLVEGVDVGDPKDPRTVKFLRRIPIDPMTGVAEWGLRSYQDDWDSRSWGRENVYDVYSLSDLRALDGSYYRDW